MHTVFTDHEKVLHVLVRGPCQGPGKPTLASPNRRHVCCSSVSGFPHDSQQSVSGPNALAKVFTLSTRSVQERSETLDETVSVVEETSVGNVETVIIHSDGSYNRESDASGAGFMLETNGGETIREQWRITSTANTSLETEAAAALAAVREAKKFGPSYIILYSDCKELVRLLESDADLSNRASMYERTRELLETVEFTTIKHIPRDRNKRAHDLAHRAMREAQGENGSRQQGLGFS